VNKPDWARALSAPSGAQALITARCGRCHRVAAKYWEHDGQGVWITPNRDINRTIRTIEQILDEGHWVRNMVAERVCHCEPPPTLPAGDKLAELIARAHRKAFDHRAQAGWGLIKIRV